MKYFVLPRVVLIFSLLFIQTVNSYAQPSNVKSESLRLGPLAVPDYAKPIKWLPSPQAAKIANTVLETEGVFVSEPVFALKNASDGVFFGIWQEQAEGRLPQFDISPPPFPAEWGVIPSSVQMKKASTLSGLPYVWFTGAGPGDGYLFTTENKKKLTKSVWFDIAVTYINSSGRYVNGVASLYYRGTENSYKTDEKTLFDLVNSFYLLPEYKSISREAYLAYFEGQKQPTSEKKPTEPNQARAVATAPPLVTQNSPATNNATPLSYLEAFDYVMSIHSISEKSLNVISPSTLPAACDALQQGSFDADLNKVYMLCRNILFNSMNARNTNKSYQAFEAEIKKRKEIASRIK